MKMVLFSDCAKYKAILFLHKEKMQVTENKIVNGLQNAVHSR